MSALNGYRILIIAGCHLANAPRVQKEARTLRLAGAEVIVCGTWSSAALADEDVLLARLLDIDFRPVVDIRNASGFRIRVLQRLATELYKRFKWVSSRNFGIGVPELLQEARRIKADLTIVHLESGLWIAKELLATNQSVGVDFDDWFSQDLPEADRLGRPVVALQALERHLLVHASYCTTTTRVMAAAIAADAKSNRLPIAIPNCFPAADREQAELGPGDVTAQGCVAFHWFSQTIGPNRGLETLAQALELLSGNWCLSLRGNIKHYTQWFENTFSNAARAKIKILDPVPNTQLLSRIMSHDVGLALEIPYCMSRQYTATNKIFEYMRAGLAIIATNTEGQLEVMNACPDAGIVVSSEDPAELAFAMQTFINDRKRLLDSRIASKEAGGSMWAWEKFEEEFLQTVLECVTSKQQL